jgi:predicted cupin superfamily sugar epimerase/mannose-6-phosphate isomerase-like protein (cupin superfamily)
MVWFRLRAIAVAAAAFGLFGAGLSAEPVGAAAELIAHLAMAKIPVEGAWFKVTYGSSIRLPAEVLPPRYGAARAAGSAIYALVTREDFSALHRLKTDEIWHFYQGDPIELLLLYPDGRSDTLVLGPDVVAGMRPQFAIPAGTWMGARPVKATADAYALFGCTLAPGFDYADFEPGYRDELQRQYPDRRELIAQLTRDGLATRPPAAAPAGADEKAPAPVVFSPAAVAPVPFAPGVELRELIGRVGYARTARTSVARFALGPGKSTGLSYNKVGEEYFLVLSGRGTAVVEGESRPVEAGSVVLLRPEAVHSLTAAEDSALEFYAVSTPAFSPDDYVTVPAAKPPSHGQ